MDNHNLFGDSNQQFNASYDNVNLFQNGSDSNFTDASWGLNASEYNNQPRGQLAAANSHPNNNPGWQQNANPLSLQSTHAGYTGHASPYGRPLNQSPVQFNQNQFPSYAQPQQQGFQQYRQSPYNPTHFSQPGAGQAYNATITPQALDRDAHAGFGNAPYGGHAFGGNNFGQTPPIRPASTQSQAKAANQQALLSSIPQGADSGMFSIINFDTLAQGTSSQRMSNYVNIGNEALEYNCSKGVVPSYSSRKSRNELRALAANNPTALARIGKKKSIKKETKYPTLLSDVKSTSALASGTTTIKLDEEDSSSEESSSDDDSAYSDDEEDSPLPAKRPDSPRDGVEYDTIKAVWRSKYKALPSESIRKGLVDFWELVKSIRDRWKKDAQDVTDAEEKKQTGQLPLLQSRVKDQRDMIEAAFKAALKHGHRGIIELFSENVSLIYLCYQFLLDRWRAEDVNGPLTRAILETMSLFTTLSTEKLEKTHLDKVLQRYAKKGDAKTQFYAKKVLSNADAADKEAASAKTEKKKAVTPVRDDKAASPSTKQPSSDAVAGVKRAAPSSTGDGTAAKKVATQANKTTTSSATSKVNGVVKKPVTGSENSKATSSATTAAATRKTVTPKSSGFFSSLQSASKKPGTSNADKAGTAAAKTGTKTPGSGAAAPKPAFSFAETMANLAKPKEEKPVAKPQKEEPVETAEEREKRLRKERRRKLHVTFKPNDQLVEIKYFTHDPQEELGHDSSQMRDMGDVGGEGRMLKQHAHMMDLDDDDDDATEETEDLKDHYQPTLVDFSIVDPEERKRNYAPYGGGELEPESEERAVREEYERNELIVFYEDSSQIPPNPREPAEPYSGEGEESWKNFGTPDEKFAARAQAKSSNKATGGFDISAYLKKQQQQHQAMQPSQQQQPSAPLNPDVLSILASLQKTAPAQAPPPQAASQANQPFMGAQPNNIQPPAPAPAPGPGGLDLGAILASLNAGNGQPPANYSAPNNAPMMGFGQLPQVGSANANTGPNEVDLAKIRAKNPMYKTRPCRFWQEGRCQKGDSCSYLHE